MPIRILLVMRIGYGGERPPYPICITNKIVVVDSFLLLLPFICVGSVFDPCFLMQYLVSFPVLQSF